MQSFSHSFALPSALPLVCSAHSRGEEDGAGGPAQDRGREWERWVGGRGERAGRGEARDADMVPHRHDARLFGTC